MKDLKRQSNRRPAVRKLGTSSFAERKNRSNPIPGLSLKLRKPFNEPGFRNSWLPSYFAKNEPALLREKIGWFIQRFFGICGLIFILWIAVGSVWVGKAFFNQPLKKVFFEGNQLLEDTDVLETSGLRPRQRLIDLKPYQIAARLQTHPIIQKADIRRKFPDEIHLIVSEHPPVAMLKISKKNNGLSNTALKKEDFFLIGHDQRLLKKLSMEELLNSPHKSLPLIKGLNIPLTRLGKRLNSSVLERGLTLLGTLKNISNDQTNQNQEKMTELTDHFRMVEWSSQKIRIDVSDPLNLKLHWPLKSAEFIPDSPQILRSVPLTIQMGNSNFGKRFRTFQNIFPIIDKQHPELQSIDLRYEKRVMLIPL